MKAGIRSFLFRRRDWRYAGFITVGWSANLFLFVSLLLLAASALRSVASTPPPHSSWPPACLVPVPGRVSPSERTGVTLAQPCLAWPDQAPCLAPS